NKEQLSFEKEVEQFRAKRFGLQEPLNSKDCGAEGLIELYRFFVQHATVNRSKFQPLDVLHNSISMCIEGNQIEDALRRTEALKTLLLEQGLLSDNFISFHASVKALGGDSDEWRRIMEEKRKTAEKEKAEKHQKDVD